MSPDYDSNVPPGYLDPPKRRSKRSKRRTANRSSSRSSSSRDDRGTYLLKRFMPPLILVALMYGVRLVMAIWPDALANLGVESWATQGVPGLIVAPFLHTDLIHLIINTIPMLLLGWFVSIESGGGWRFWFITALIAVGSGAGAWFTHAPGTITQGSSAIVIGYGTYVVARMFVGWNTRHRYRYGIIAILVLAAYGFALTSGLLTPEPNVTWQSHASAAFAGVASAIIVSNRYMTNEVIYGKRLPKSL